MTEDLDATARRLHDTHDTVAEYLAEGEFIYQELTSRREDQPGGYVTVLGDAAVMISAVEIESYIWVVFASVLAVKVEESAALYRFCATSENPFGALRVVRDESGLSVRMTHLLLAEYLDPLELTHTLTTFGNAASAIAGVLRNTFGGRDPLQQT